MKNIIFLLILLSISSNVFSGGYLTKLHEPGVTIERYFVHSGGGISLMLSKKLPLNPDSCDYAHHVYIKGDKKGHQAMIAAALAAFSSGKQVGLYSSGCEIIPFWEGTFTRPVVSELWVIQ